MPFILAVDYDGTVVRDAFPEKGEAKQEIIDKVKEFIECGAEVVLWTCREGKMLEEAVQRCKDMGLEFASVNENPPSQLEYMEKEKAKGNVFALRKIYADFYVDDKAHNLDFFLRIKSKETCEAFKNR
jgi:hypothetical protein